MSSPQVAGGADIGSYALTFDNASLSASGEARAALVDKGGPLSLDASITLTPQSRTGLLSGHRQGARRRTAGAAQGSWIISHSCMRATPKDEFPSTSNSHFDECDGRHCFTIQYVYRTFTAICTEAPRCCCSPSSPICCPVPAEQPDQGALPLNPAVGTSGPHHHRPGLRSRRDVARLSRAAGALCAAATRLETL